MRQWVRPNDLGLHVLGLLELLDFPLSRPHPLCGDEIRDRKSFRHHTKDFHLLPVPRVDNTKYPADGPPTKGDRPTFIFPPAEAEAKVQPPEIDRQKSKMEFTRFIAWETPSNPVTTAAPVAEANTLRWASQPRLSVRPHREPRVPAAPVASLPPFYSRRKRSGTGVRKS